MSRPKSRQSEERAASSRAAQERTVPQVGHKGRFHIPAHVIPKGMTYAWVAYLFDNSGVENRDNFTQAYRRGWRPVPRTRHPELFPIIPSLGMSQDNDDTIKEGGQVLCEMPTAQVNELLKAKSKKAKSQMDGVSWMQSQGQNPFMPRFDQSNATFGHAASQPAEFKE